mmetsp:Transcript_14619/g.24919  ORF Transcript_14619/g.24919 Transcript_14619/m.24919 type:complete len:140 (-) Transcript_14619:740-1159(-)
MGCYSNETKHSCSVIVTIVSVLGLILGFVVTGYGVLQTGHASEFTSQYAEFDVENGFAIGTIISGAACILVGMLGILTGRFKNACTAIPFMFFGTILVVLLIIAAAISGGDKQQVQSVIDDGCAKQWPNFEDKSTETLI